MPPGGLRPFGLDLGVGQAMASEEFLDRADGRNLSKTKSLEVLLDSGGTNQSILGRLTITRLPDFSEMKDRLLHMEIGLMGHLMGGTASILQRIRTKINKTIPPFIEPCGRTL